MAKRWINALSIFYLINIHSTASYSNKFYDVSESIFFQKYFFPFENSSLFHDSYFFGDFVAIVSWFVDFRSVFLHCFFIVTTRFYDPLTCWSPIVFEFKWKYLKKNYCKDLILWSVSLLFSSYLSSKKQRKIISIKLNDPIAVE